MLLHCNESMSLYSLSRYKSLVRFKRKSKQSSGTRHILEKLL